MATQNPIEYEGTFPLPEAQLDRFLMRLSLGYPGAEEERQILLNLRREHPITDLGQIVRWEDLPDLQRQVWETKARDISVPGTTASCFWASAQVHLYG